MFFPIMFFLTGVASELSRGPQVLPRQIWSDKTYPKRRCCLFNPRMSSLTKTCVTVKMIVYSTTNEFDFEAMGASQS